jgi:Iron-containing alcohol dehydrogenase
MIISDEPFLYNALPTRVIFGFGTMSRTGDEIRRLGSKRPLILSTPGHRTEAEALSVQLGMDIAGVFAEATMHTPLEITERSIAAVHEKHGDGLIAFGGGSTTGLAKAIALRTDLPQLILPTTYAGSEMTNTLGETSEGKKTVIRSPKVQPECVIYDVDLTFTLPPRTSATSGMNALAHAVEGLYAENNNPIVSLLARCGSETTSIDYSSIFVESAVMAPDISKIDTDRHPNPGMPVWNFRDKVIRRLLHGKQSLPFGAPAHPIYRYRSNHLVLYWHIRPPLEGAQVARNKCIMRFLLAAKARPDFLLGR